MRKFLTFILALSVLIPPVSAQAVQEPRLSASASILLHADSGKVLLEHNADERMLIASTTKVMTALVALDYAEPDELVTIPAEATRVEGSSMYLKAGAEYSVRDILAGLLLVSGNDAALALAYHIGGDIETFAELMNAKAAELGLLNTAFKNPHGLDAEGHYSSARDLALIMRAAMENETFREITAMKTCKAGEMVYVNHNKLLWRYSGTTGGKTGYTKAAGRSLISTAERDGLRLICVTLNDPDDWNDHASLYDWAFAAFAYTEVQLPYEVKIPVISGLRDSVGVSLDGELRALIRRGDEMQICLELPRFVFAEVRAGDAAGRLILSSGGEYAAEIGLCYAETVAMSRKLSSWERFKRAWQLSGQFEPEFKIKQGPLKN